MPESESGWHYAGSSEVTKQGKINFPERLFEEEILNPDQVVYWSHEKVVGFVLISNQPLERREYTTHTHAQIGEPESYRTNIPKIFFEDYQGRGRGEHEQPLPEKARIRYGERRFFAFKTEMADGETRSCYVFNWEQFDNTIGDDQWADSLDRIPRFN